MYTNTMLNILAGFGVVAAIVTIPRFAQKAWRLFGPCTIKEPFSPELGSQMKRTDRVFKALGLRGKIMISEQNRPN